MRARWLRYANGPLRGLFPYLPTQSGYNKRVRAATGMLRAVIAHLVACTSRCTDDVWVVDSTPVECGRSRETTKRSDLAGWAEYGYCASHSRFFWGLRLHLVCAVSGLPVAFALTGAKADEREILLGMLDADPNLLATHPGQTLMADKNYSGRQFEAALADAGIELLRPARKGEKPRAGQRFFKPLRQVVESVNNTLRPNRVRGAVRPTAGHAPLVLTGRDAARLDAAREPSAPARVSSAAQYAADQIASVRFKSQLDLE